MTEFPEIKLYGADSCHKTDYYKSFFKKHHLPYTFFDVRANEIYAHELCKLYENGRLNFPTITIGKKKLRNPTRKELNKWTNKLVK